MTVTARVNESASESEIANGIVNGKEIGDGVYEEESGNVIDWMESASGCGYDCGYQGAMNNSSSLQ